MAVLFDETFESQTFDNFDDLTVQGSATAQIVAQPYQGQYSGEFRVTPSPNYAISRAVKYIQGSKLHIKAFVNIASAVLPYNVTIPVVTLSQSDPIETICSVQVEGKGGQTVWRVMARNGTVWVGDFSVDIPVQAGYNEVDLFWEKDPVNGYVQIYLNGALIGEVQGIDTSLFNVERSYFGVVYKADSVSQPGAETVDFTVTIDNITISGIAEFATLTYSSSPIDVSILVSGVTVNSGESVQVPLNTTITVEAPVTSEGKMFLNWLVNNVEVAVNPVDIAVTGDIVLVALYSPDVPPNRYEEIAALAVTIGTTILLFVSVLPTIIKGKS